MNNNMKNKEFGVIKGQHEMRFKEKQIEINNLEMEVSRLVGEN